MKTTKGKTKSGTKVLVLRCCDANLRSYNGFQWPSKTGAVVKAPDWDSTPDCGNGLHGWIYGGGDSSCSSYVDNADAKWLVVEVALSSIVMLGGKCKFPQCTIRHVGDRKSATDFIIANEANTRNFAVIGATITVGDKEAATAGNYGTATAGNYGTATAGESGTATAGNYGTATAGESGTATAGNYGTATAGYRGTATAGNYGTATAGYRGTATAGESGTATAGNYGTATAGESGEIRIRYYDFNASRYRTVIGYVGEDGIEANKKYKLTDKHKFALVD